MFTPLSYTRLRIC